MSLRNQFRSAVYQTIDPSRDAAFEIIDAIAGSPHARSAVEVSLSPTFERKFSSVYKGVERARFDEETLIPLLVSTAEQQGTLWFDDWALYALDHSPYPRQAAPTVSDRGYVHGADGIVVGHQYSLLGRVMHEAGSWVGVVDCQRIATHQTPTRVGASQIARLKVYAQIRRIITADSEYVTDEVLDQADDKTRLLIRFRSNRKLYRAPQEKLPDAQGRKPKGRKPQHGEKIQLNHEETLREPDQRLRVDQSNGGWVMISVWKDVHVQSRPNLPLCAVRVEVFQADGRRCYQRPLSPGLDGAGRDGLGQVLARLLETVLHRVRASVHQEFARLDTSAIRLHGARRTP